MAEGVTTTGLEEHRRDIDRLTDVEQQQLVTKVVAPTAQRIATRARQLVRVRSGYTHDQIEVHHDPTRRQSQVTVGPTSSHPGTKEHPPMVPVFLEYGTRFMSAYPFMRPAADAERDRYATDLATISGQILQGAFR
jgi:HK97 gp10 family phage protein